MAIYEYTLRSETKTIDGIEIGRYSYAYKHSSSDDSYPGGRSRRTRAAEARALDARYANRHVRHFIMADSFADAADEPGYSVFQIDGEPRISMSSVPAGALIVGKLVRDGRRFKFAPTVPYAVRG